MTPSLDSVGRLCEALRAGRLLEPAQFQELPALQVRFSSPRLLARELVRRGWLTPFQVNALFQGYGPALLHGSYVLLDNLGEGGMGAVYRARNWKLGKVVALKVIRRERLGGESAVRRFEREIRAAARLDHPNIVHAYDADRVGDILLLVMEYVDGGTDLARLVKQKGPLPVGQACAYVRQAALGLQHAHERGLVHRDVKPHNLLLSRDGVVKVLDLGLAHLGHSGDDSSRALTQGRTVTGTLDYIAPEQAADAGAVDARADLYSLGCTLYFLLSGRVPFPGGKPVEKVSRHRSEEPAPLEGLRPDVPPAVAAVVRRLMAKRPEDRYRTAAEAAAALAAVPPAPAPTPAGAIEDAGPAPSPDVFARVAEETPPTPPPGVGPTRGPSRRLLLAVLVGTLLLLGVGVLLAFLVRGAPGPVERPAVLFRARSDLRTASPCRSFGLDSPRRPFQNEPARTS